jgi:hypothetical protein
MKSSLAKLMKTNVSRVFFFLFCGIAALSAFAQTAPKSSIPFSVGEVLTYEGKLNKAIFRGISVADLRFTVNDSPDSKYFVFSTEANSKGSVAKLFNFRFRQVYESTFDKEKFRILRTVKHDEQRERVRDGEAVFDYGEKRVIYVETDPKDMMRPPRKIASIIREDTVDLLSGIYYLRRLPLAVGSVFEISVSDSGFVYAIPVRITAREKQNTIVGKVWCFRVEPEVFGTKRLIEDDGKMIIWITDDKRRLPVRAQIHTGIGKIEIKLRKVGK